MPAARLSRIAMPTAVQPKYKNTRFAKVRKLKIKIVCARNERTTHDREELRARVNKVQTQNTEARLNQPQISFAVITIIIIFTARAKINCGKNKCKKVELELLTSRVIIFLQHVLTEFANNILGCSGKSLAPKNVMSSTPVWSRTYRCGSLLPCVVILYKLSL